MSFFRNFGSFVFVQVFLFACSDNGVQALVTAPDLYYLEIREDQKLMGNIPQEFLGYYPLLFEYEPMGSQSGFRADWVNFAENQPAYFLRVSGNYSGLYQTPYLEPLMGSKQWPIEYSDLLQNSEGLPAQYHSNAYACLDGKLLPLNWLALKGRLYGGKGFGHDRTWYQVNQLYSEIRLNRLVISIGRKPVFWGQSKTGPFLQSLNAQNLDVIEISNLPVELPWFLKYLGTARTEFFFSKMNKNRTPSNDYFTGWRFGLKPTDILEVNISGVYQWGGDGIPSESFGHAVTEYLGGRVQTGSNKLDASNFFNRAGQVDIRLSFSDWELPTSFYTEQHLEDCCGNPIFLLKKSISYTYGVLLRTNHKTDAHRIRIEYMKSGNGLYYHSTWPSAATNEGRIQGNQIGRDAQELYLEWGREFPFSNIDFLFYAFWRERLRTGRMSIVSEYPDYDLHDLVPDFSQSEKSTSVGFNLKYEVARRWFLDFGAQGIAVLNKRGRGGDNRFESGAYSAISYSF